MKDEENFLQNTHKTPEKEMRFSFFYVLHYYVGRWKSISCIYGKE